MPDIINNHFVTFMQYLVNHPVITGPDPVQVFSTGKLVYPMGKGIGCKFLDVFKNVCNHFTGNSPEILFSTLPERY